MNVNRKRHNTKQDTTAWITLATITFVKVKTHDLTLRLNVKVTRLSGKRDKALLFRGWSRLCLHAASLSAAEGASASATACARATRAEAMEKEAKAATEKTAASAEVAATKKEGQREITREPEVANEIGLRSKDTEHEGGEHQLRRAKMLVGVICSLKNLRRCSHDVKRMGRQEQ